MICQYCKQRVIQEELKNCIECNKEFKTRDSKRRLCDSLTCKAIRQKKMIKIWVQQHKEYARDYHKKYKAMLERKFKTD